MTKEPQCSHTLPDPVLATVPLKFFRLYPVLPTSVFGFYVSALFNLFSHGKTRWPSQKIPICSRMLMVTETSFLASNDESFPFFFFLTIPCVITRVLRVVFLNHITTHFLCLVYEQASSLSMISNNSCRDSPNTPFSAML